MTILPAAFVLACASGNLPTTFDFIGAAEPGPAVGVTLVYRETITPTGTLAITVTPTFAALQSVTRTVTVPAAPVALATDTPLPKPSATPIPTNTQIPLPSPSPTDQVNIITPTAPLFTISGGQPVGTLNLVAPEQDISYPANVGGVEFKWHWSGGCQAPEGHGFQIRIRPAITGTVPLGVMDVMEGQKYIGCDVDTGFRSYVLNNLKGAPGVLEAHTGKFLWDVAYVKLEPYIELAISPPRIFEITFKYTGPIDPHGADLSCSDFPSWTEAQAIFILAGGNDPHGLDEDGNGIACEELR